MTAIQDRLIGDLERTRGHLESLRLRKQMADIQDRLGSYSRPEVASLHRAIEDRDIEAYTRAYHDVVAAAGRRQHALRRKELLAS